MEIKISITITEEDLQTLKAIPDSLDTSGIIAHVISLTEDKL